jgi:transcriptional antiterminator/mannitol/fructose-specific phosphotransferase system IIA component (Ntr-type)
MLFYWQDNYLSVYHFLDSLNIGKTSFTNTSHQLEIELENSNIGISYTRKEGYFLTGAEIEIRAKLITLILEDLVIDGDDFLYRYFLIKEKIGFDDFKEVSETILKFLKKYAISLVENRLKEFSYIFFLLLPRLRKVCKEIENKIDQKLLIGTKEYAFSKEILSHFGIENQEAIIYISSWLLGSALGNINDQGSDYQRIYEMTEHIVQRFEMLSGVRFKDKTPIIQRLYSHFRPVYYRLCFHLPIINNLYEKIIQEYSAIYMIVEEMMRPFADSLEMTIPKEEIAFLSMHFASYLQEYDETIVQQKVGVIVCPNGIGSSAIIYNELKSMFPDFILLGPMETNELFKTKQNYDIIFATSSNIRLFTLKKPIYFVNPIMTNKEKIQLTYEIYNGKKLPMRAQNVQDILQIVDKYSGIEHKDKLKQEIQNYFHQELSTSEDCRIEKGEKSLKELLKPEYVQTQVPARSWEEALYFAATPLIEREIITRGYIDTIIRMTRTEGAFYVLMDKVALVHSKPNDGALQLGLGLSVLSESIDIVDKPVKYILTLSALDNKQHLKAMAELVSLLEREQFFEMLDKENSPQKIYDWILDRID